MATRSVRFEFHLQKAPEIAKFDHQFPSSLVVPEGQQSNPQYLKEFVGAVTPIMKEHYEFCRAHSSPDCTHCGGPATTVLQTPMSWIHIIEDPFINVLVNPICAKRECETKVRQLVQTTMDMISEGAGVSTSTTEILPCKICGSTTNIMKCAKCKTVGYCGKEHQKADWKVHKKLCATYETERLRAHKA